jgi:hypothetical protein
VTAVAGVDLTQYVQFDPNTNSYDYSGLNELMKGKEYNADTERGKAIIAWRDKLD